MKPAVSKLSRRKSSNGASLIEILVALLVLSFGVLGMAAMQIRAVKGNHSAMQRTQAVMLSYYIMDAMRVDASNARGLNYNTGGTYDTATGKISDPVCDATSYGTPTTLQDVNRQHWIQSLKTGVGAAGDSTTCGAILCDANGVCRVQIFWDDSRIGGLSEQMVETISRI